MDQVHASNKQDFEILSLDNVNDPFNESSLKNCYSVSELWDGKTMRKAQTENTISWVLPLADWKVGLTLTFRNDKPYDSAIFYWKMLIRELNQELFGKHYTKIVKHSYFSYAYGIEYQRRDVIHFHAIADKPLNFKKIHSLWNRWAGFAWTDIIESPSGMVSYLSKYNLKRGHVVVYKAKKDYVPSILPFWWKKDEEVQLDLFKAFSGVLADLEIASRPVKH